jgi:molecular chaperone IbpA
MATLDFTPLYHLTVGFDRLPDLLAHALARDESGYPPYNEKTADDAYRIVMALAGFSRDDIELSVSAISCPCVVRSRARTRARTCTKGSRNALPEGA